MSINSSRTASETIKVAVLKVRCHEIDSINNPKKKNRGHYEN